MLSTPPLKILLKPNAMRNILASLIMLSSYACAGEWVVTEGGLSPDGKLAVAVLPQVMESDDGAQDTVFLVDPVKDRKIGPLEEVSSYGGSWGTPTTNVNCVWSADSTILVVNYRAGRLMRSSQIYRVQNRRAVPLKLPARKTHPKGVILEGLSTTNNPGSEVTLNKDGSILERAWGLVPDWNLDYSKHGLKDFEGSLEFHYRFDEKGNLILHDITVPPIQ